MEPEQLGQCFLCLVQCSNKCQTCSNDIWFCGPEHEALHRSEEEDSECRPFKVSHRDGIGRCLVATRKIAAGELVFEERPLAVGPLHDTVPVCLTCFKTVSGNFKCPECQLPMCNDDCSQDASHRLNECDIMAKLKPKISIDRFDKTHPFYHCITPLRCLRLKDTSPLLWRTMQPMMDHIEDKPKDLNWEASQTNVVKFLRSKCELAYTEDEINHVVGLLEVNAFEVKGIRPGRGQEEVTDLEVQDRWQVPNEHITEDSEGGLGRGVFPLTALMSHSCVANTRYIMSLDQTCQCRANVDIEAGDEITDFYVSPLHGTQYRRRCLRDGWYFECQCARCKDPTEFGSFMDAFKCVDCDPTSTAVISLNSLDFNADFICNKCEFVYDRKSLEEVEEKFAELVDEADKNDDALLEQLLDMGLAKLHPKNYLIILLKRHLIYIHGRVPGKLLKDLPIEKVNQKLQFCQDILDSYDIVSPGLTKERGLTLYEKVSVMIFLTKQSLTSITEHEERLSTVKTIKECIGILEEVIKCVQHERPGTFEHLVLNAATRTLRECRDLFELLTLIPLDQLKFSLWTQN